MKIDNLYLKDFRNIDELQIQFSPRLNIFVGDNGQGKTNILEAIYFLLEKNSFRFGNNTTFIKDKKFFSILNAELKQSDKNEKEFKIRVILEPSNKKYTVNEKPSVSYQNQLPSTVLFSPESLNIIKQSAEERRALIDSVVKSVYYSNQSLILDFKKTLKTRNRLLSDISEKKTDLSSGIDTLQSLNTIFLKLAANLTSVRIASLKSIRPLVNEIFKKLEPNKGVEFDFRYIISDQNSENETYENLYQIMQKRIAELTSAELSFGSSLVGPHKHDVTFLYNGKDSRFFCSQGQQRSIILAFKMAQIVYHQKVNGTYPILLLDDVLSELDSTKQEALIKYLNEIETQTFLTTTDVESLSKLDAENKFKFKIQDGKII